MNIKGVSIDFIDALNESARSVYPDEFICLHRAHGGIIDEMVMLPGTVFGDSHSFIMDWMDPIDFQRTGSFPSRVLQRGVGGRPAGFREHGRGALHHLPAVRQDQLESL